jgi:hypothetical protein
MGIVRCRARHQACGFALVIEGHGVGDKGRKEWDKGGRYGTKRWGGGDKGVERVLGPFLGGLALGGTARSC